MKNRKILIYCKYTHEEILLVLFDKKQIIQKNILTAIKFLVQDKHEDVIQVL